jgi:hypothetical protein
VVTAAASLRRAALAASLSPEALAGAGAFAGTALNDDLWLSWRARARAHPGPE